MSKHEQTAKDVNSVPGQDQTLWNHRLFIEVIAPVDWCTARQAAEIAEQANRPDSVLQDTIDALVLAKQQAIEKGLDTRGYDSELLYYRALLKGP